MNKNRIMKYLEQPIKRVLEAREQNIAFTNFLKQVNGGAVSIDDILSELTGDYQQRRLAECIQYLWQLMDIIDESKIDKQFLATEEFSDLLAMTIENSIRTRHKERILLNCKLLVGSLLIKNKELRHSTEDLLNLVSQLVPTDLLVAARIYEQQENRPAIFDFNTQGKGELNFVTEKGWDYIQESCKLDDVDFRLSLTKLSNSGLIKEVVGMYMGYTGGKYIITYTFQRLMSLIEFSNNAIFSYKLD